MQAAPKVVQKWEKGDGEAEETKCCQKAEKAFLVLELISSNRGADAMFSHQQGKNRQSTSGQRRLGISLKQREFGQLLGNIP